MTTYPTPPIYHDIPNFGRWATDGIVLVREGAPAPDRMLADTEPHPWFDHIHRGDTADTLTMAMGADGDPANYHFDARLRMILAGADRVLALRPEGRLTGIRWAKRPCAVWRASALVAVVMPCQDFASFAQVDTLGMAVPR